MSTQTRVPTGVPTGGQFAASARGEATIDPWGNAPSVPAARDPWVAPRDPFRTLLPGLSPEHDSEFRDLDEPVAVLRPDDLSQEQKKRYLLLAAGVDGALGRPNTTRQGLPSCPAHGVNHRMDLGSTDANQWGGDATCTACTENGIPLPLADRLTLPERLGTTEAAATRDRMALVAQTKRRNAAESAINQVKTLFAVSEEQADYFTEDQYEAAEAFDAAFDQALFTYYGDNDTAALAETLDGIATSEGAQFADLIHGENDEPIDWLRTAVDRFREV